MTETGVSMIRLFEACRLRRYADAGGVATIGWGHAIKPGEGIGVTITQRQADALLVADIAEREAGMQALVTVDLTDPEADALGSFAFNVGVGAFSRSTLLKRVNSGATQDAADQFLRWVFAAKVRQRGLVRRRNAEAARYLGASLLLVTAIYDGAA
jgi:lysozyme